RPAPRGAGRIEHLKNQSFVVGLQSSAKAKPKQPCHSERSEESRSARTHPYRLLYWNRFRAPFCPYFLRSFERESRLTIPSAFSFLRSSRLNSMRARAMPSFTASAWPFTPPPLTRARTLNVATVSVESNGCFALERCDSVTKYCSKGRPLTLKSPL